MWFACVVMTETFKCMEKTQVHVYFMKLLSEEYHARRAQEIIRTKRVALEGYDIAVTVVVMSKYLSFRWSLNGLSIRVHAFHQINSFKHWGRTQHGEIMEFA